MDRTTHRSQRRSAPRTIHLLLAAAMVLAVLGPVGTATAQVPGSNGGVTFDNGLAYEVVHTTYATGGENAQLSFSSGITGIGVDGEGTVFFAEHHGGIHYLDPLTGLSQSLGRVDAATHKCRDCNETGLWESGLHGFALANDFDETGHFYVSYSVADSSCDIPDNIAGETNAGCWHLSRFTVEDAPGGLVGAGKTVDFSDEEVILTWPFSRYAPHNPAGRSAAHQGGGITVLPDDSIVIAVGDNTSHASHGGYGPRDSRPERWYFNGERTSGNPADRRGKLLRVNPDGSVPADNPFIDDVGEYRYGGEVAYDPYILAMGMRNTYRVASDPVTGAVYSGQVGPDARNDDPSRGPRGEEELNVHLREDCTTPSETGLCAFAEFDGGYPRCIGPNRPYIQYDYVNDVSLGIPEDCSGFDEPVLYYHPNGQESQWPELQNGGGNTIVPLAVYQSDAPTALEELQSSLLLFDWSRGWMATIPVTDDGELDVRPEVVDRVATGFTGPIGAAVAPDGSVYVAELGGYGSVSSRIGRIYSPDSGAPLTESVPVTASAVGTGAAGAMAALALVVAAAVLHRRREIV